MYPSNTKNTEKLTIREVDFYKIIVPKINSNFGQTIQIWALIFDDTPENIRSILHGEIQSELSFKNYYFKGVINSSEQETPLITSSSDQFTISYHSFIGTPMILFVHRNMQLMISDLYIKINDIEVSPKNFIPNHNNNWIKV